MGRYILTNFVGMKHIPFLLILSRLVLAVLFLLLLWIDIPREQLVVSGLIILGLLTDVFDGIIARKLQISTKALRVWDSNIDQIFWASTLLYAFYFNFDFLKQHWFWITVVLVLEGLAYLISYLRFKRTIATHAISAKIWTISLLVFIVDLILHQDSTIAYWTCIGLGILSRIELILITSLLREWATDIPTVFNVSKINRNEPIKRNKWFNG